MFEEVVEDLVDRVQTPEPPLPDLTNEETFSTEFEAQNLKYELWYTKHTFDLFHGLIKEIQRRTPEDLGYWNGSIDTLYVWINEIKSERGRAFCQDLFNSYVNYAK